MLFFKTVSFEIDWYVTVLVTVNIHTNTKAMYYHLLKPYIEGLAQDCSNSIANVLELLH